MRPKKSTMLLFIAPAIILFLVFFCYPMLRTLAMSFFEVKSMSSSVNEWSFNGIQNFKALNATSFPDSLGMLLRVWPICGVVIFAFALFFAVMLTSGIKLKGFFRSMLYLPNVIPQIAVGYMWTLYVFSARFGLLKKFFSAIGWTAMAEFGWTSPDHMFLSMCIAYIFSNMGYFVLMYMAAIESIPKSLYEAATIDGAASICTVPKHHTPDDPQYAGLLNHDLDDPRVRVLRTVARLRSRVYGFAADVHL